MVKKGPERADDTTVTILARALRLGGAALVCSLALTSVPLPAVANDGSRVRSQAREAAAAVRQLTGRLQLAQIEYVAALAGVGQQVTSSVLAQTERDDVRRSARRAAAERTNTVRALYMSGGQSALIASLLGSDDAGDLAGRILAIGHLLDAASSTARLTDLAQNAADTTAAAAARAADASVVTASLVAERAAAVDTLVTEAQSRLDALSARARAMAEAEQAAQALARVVAEAAAAATSAVGSARAQLPPAAYFALYRAAAPTCPGLSWTLLAAVGQVESGHGRNNGPSSAGAVGPMQFMPQTFAGYAVDGDRDGRANPWSPADAIYTAAKFLCSNGAGSPSGLPRALLRYNNAQWYVDLVLAVQAQIETAVLPGVLPG